MLHPFGFHIQGYTPVPLGYVIPTHWPSDFDSSVDEERSLDPGSMSPSYCRSDNILGMDLGSSLAKLKAKVTYVSLLHLAIATSLA